VAWFALLALGVASVRGNDLLDNELGSGSDRGGGRGSGLWALEGKVVTSPDVEMTPQWLSTTRVVVNYGEYLAFLRRDGSFEVNNLPPGSYLVEVSNPDYFYEPIRVDVTSKGKIRSRKVNYIQANVVQQLPYPLKFKPKVPFKYFQVRETWRITDFLFNPMVLMMVVPLLLIMVLPKMMNAADPETQREMQNMQMPKYDMPELSEMMTSLFTGGAPKPGSSSATGSSTPLQAGKSKTPKKRQ
jgi:hypothetical protein